MQAFLQQFFQAVPYSGNTCKDADALFMANGCGDRMKHYRGVPDRARKLAIKYGEDSKKAFIAGWLHDISAIIPSRYYMETAKEYRLEVLAEEEYYPVILHQKISVLLASHIFNITDLEILTAIGCHTTLRENASQLDKIVFLADKIEHEMTNTDISANILSYLESSLDHGSFFYLDHLIQNKENLFVLHPWLVAAHSQLKQSIKGCDLNVDRGSIS